MKACALGQAAAALLGQVVIGRSATELAQARTQLHAMLTADGPIPDAPFDGYEVLLPAREYRNRHALYPFWRSTPRSKPAESLTSETTS